MPGYFRNFVFKSVLTAAMLFPAAGFAVAQNDDKPKPRDIVPVFETSRPTGSSASGTAGGNATPSNSAGNQPAGGNATTAAASPNKPKRPPYSRISQKINSGKIGKLDRPGANRPPKPPPSSTTAAAANWQKPPADIQVAGARQIGITLWKLLPAKYKNLNVTSDEEYLPQINNGRTNVLTPARVSLDTLFQPGDYVRFSVEAGQRGYLYVVDQEMYQDGTLGDAYLVFPSRRLRGGANLIAPGSPIELPDLTNNPFYFELRPQSQNGKPMLAEVLSVIVTDRPIAGIVAGDQPQLINEATLADWRRKWAGRAEIYESANGSGGGGYTKAERLAASGKSKLGRNDPLPQTVFLVEANRSGGGTLITVPLWYGNE